jgi:dephospho-CoA kinase
MNRNKIALMGRARVGKNHVATVITKMWGHEQLAFADKMKSSAAQLFPDKVTYKVKPRKLYQDYGQKMREIDPDVWVKHLHQKADQLPYVVITDLRQPNEHEYCRKMGYTIIRVVCDEEVRKGRILAAGEKYVPEEMHHETESHVDTLPADFVIDSTSADNVEILFKLYDGLAQGESNGRV